MRTLRSGSRISTPYSMVSRDDLPLAQVLILHLDRGITKDAKRIGHVVDFVIGTVSRERRLEVSAGDRAQCLRSAPSAVR